MRPAAPRFPTRHSLLATPSPKGFTLIELLIVIAIVAILATVVVLTLNPAQQLKQSRDSDRMASLATLNKALSIFAADVGSGIGSANTIYVSMPDTTTTCANLGLPGLASGWSYNCVTQANLRNTDGTGWLPVDFSSVSFKSPIGSLPIDPLNTTSTRNFFTYYTDGNGKYELDSYLESDKYYLNGSRDGGDSPALESGSNLSIAPFKTYFYFDNFPAASAQNGQPAWYRQTAPPTISTSSDAEGTYLRVTGYGWYEWQENIPFNPNALYKISCKVRQIADPTVGGKSIYCGVAGVAANGTAYINTLGGNSYSSQHYIAANGSSLTAGAGYTTFYGYFKGYGTPAGGVSTSKTAPAKMYPGVAYFRPLFILNYATGNGTADIAMEITEVDQ